MFSFTHIAIIFLIALLVFGPEKLPEIARHLGKALGDFRRASADFRRVIDQEFAEIERQAREKEEQARQKALQATNPPPVEGAQTVAATPFTAASADPPVTPAPAGTIASTSAQDSGNSPRENQATPADVHPA